MASTGNTRKAIPKGVRFDVFKRDSFRGQYCGATAPDVLLEIDHIKPVAKYGDNDITNLLTACQPCNSGKSDKTLNENTTVAKARSQLDQLQERREQLEMMVSWMEGLRDIQVTTADRVASYWYELAPGFTMNQNGRNKLQKWLRKFTIEEVCHAMDIAAEQYLRFEDDESATEASWTEAFGKIPGICRVEHASKTEPDLKELYYIRGILKNRIDGRHYKAPEALKWLKAARSWDVSLEELREMAKRITSWSQFCDSVYKCIEDQKVLQGFEDET
ncbi:MAG: HNH endonuclease [Planctomycetales bacterium]|jgi:hypothetical protein